MEDGTYGICEVCGKPIPFERLEAIPTTTFCKEHSPDQVVSQQRPIEESVLSPPFGEFVVHKEAETFDAEDSWQKLRVSVHQKHLQMFKKTPCIMIECILTPENKSAMSSRLKHLRRQTFTEQVLRFIRTLYTNNMNKCLTTSSLCLRSATSLHTKKILILLKKSCEHMLTGLFY